MKNKHFLIPMLLSMLGFATSTAWLLYELVIQWRYIAYRFNFDVIPTFAIALGIYGLCSVMYHGKSRYVRRVKVTPINSTHGVPDNSQTPVLLCTKK